MPKRLRALAILLTCMPCPGLGQSLPERDRIGELEERLAALEAELERFREELGRLREGRSEAAREAPAETRASEIQPGRPSSGPADPGAVGLESPDGSVNARVRGYFQADGRFFPQGADAATRNTFLLRRVRPVLQVTALEAFEMRLMPDFGGDRAQIQDLTIHWRILPSFQLTAGRFKSPVGLERLQSAIALHFVERGLPTHLVPNRDIGVILHGRLREGSLDYAAGVFNGARDGASAGIDVDSHKDLALRIFSHPFRNRGAGSLRGLGIGLAATYGRHEGPPRNYATTGQQDFLRFLPGVVHDGTLWRLSPQGYYYRGPLGVLAEWTLSSQELRRNESRESLQHRAWQVVTSFVLTGEEASHQGVRPRRNVGDGGRGALEVAARVGQLRIDPQAFPLFAAPGENSARATGLGLAVHWYLSRHVRWTLDYGRTGFLSPRLDLPSRSPEHTLFGRLQFAF